MIFGGAKFVGGRRRYEPRRFREVWHHILTFFIAYRHTACVYALLISGIAIDAGTNLSDVCFALEPHISTT